MNDDFLLPKKLQWKSTRAFALIAIFVVPITLLRWLNNEVQISLWPFYFSLFLAILALIVILRFPNMSSRQLLTLFISIYASISLSSSYMAHNFHALNGETEIFTAYKALPIVIALLAPTPVWLGYTLIATSLFVPPLQMLLLDPELSSYTQNREPWKSMLFPVISFFVLRYRLESQALEISLINSRAKEKSLRDFAEISLALRDLMNTPVQSLDLLTDLLRSNEISPKQAGDLLKETNHQLHEIIHVFNENQSKLLKHGPAESFDSVETLRDKFKKSFQDISDSR